MSDENAIKEGRAPADERPVPDGVDVAPGRPRRAEGKKAAVNANEDAPSGEKPVNGPTPEAAVPPEEPPEEEAVVEEDELAKARREAREMKDAWTRERAEFINYKKRSAQDQARSRMHTVADFVSGLLPVIDNLETVLKVKTENPEVQNFVSGVEMIRGEFLNVLERHHILRVNAQGIPFDPQCMEGIAMEERPELAEDTVLEVFQEGFILQYESGENKVLRPARVKVGKTVAGSSGGETPDSDAETAEPGDADGES